MVTNTPKNADKDSNEPDQKIIEELAAERDKCQRIWKELVQVGKSWETQADYIKSIELERGRLSSTLREVCDAYHQLLRDLIDPERSLTSAELAAKRFSMDAVPTSVDVVLCYLVFYCRLPESYKDIDDLLKNIRNRGELLEAFFSAQETRQWYPTLVPFKLSGHESAQPIEQVESKEVLQEFFNHTGRVWSQFGDTDAHWSVITDDRFRAASIDKQKDLFYTSGRFDAEWFVKTLERNGIPQKKIQSVIDFGCGVGRITTNLHTEFKTLYGVDISKGHLKLAEEYCENKGIRNINWIHLKNLHDLDDLPAVDAFLTLIVLQHNPPPVSQHIIKCLLAKLNSGGVGFFQVPIYIKGYQFRAKPYLNSAETATEMEMHPIPQSRIFQIFEEANVRLLEVIEDQCCRDVEGVSNTFLVQKR